MSAYEPILTRTAVIDELSMEIAEMVGRLTPTSDLSTSPTLHRALRIQTIHSSLVIEGNALSHEQATAILDGKRVLGNANDILEVKNAAAAYELVPALNPYSLDDLLKAHKTMMQDLVKEAGSFRNKNAGVFDGTTLIHMGTPAQYVPELMRQLFDWLANSELHPLVRSCVFHYEFEFIHPFADGNGRTGRLWHTLLLANWRELLAWLPVESVILQTQQNYYAAFAQSEAMGDCAPFVEYMLGAIKTALYPYCTSENPQKQRAEALLAYVLQNPNASIQEIAEHLGVGRATVDRTIATLRQEKRLEREGTKRKGSWKVIA